METIFSIAMQVLLEKVCLEVLNTYLKLGGCRGIKVSFHPTKQNFSQFYFIVLQAFKIV